MPKPVRRIVTGHTPDGRSTIISDEPAAQVVPGVDPEGGSTVLWVTQQAPTSNAGNEDAAPAGARNPIPPPWRGGSIFRIVSFLPHSRTGSTTTLEGVQRTPDRSARHPGFHKTDTLDYAIVLE